MTNEEAGGFLGVHYSMISRMKNGERMPSGHLLWDIVRVFRLNSDEAMRAFGLGPSAFSVYFRTHVLDKNVSDFPWLTETESHPTE